MYHNQKDEFLAVKPLSRKHPVSRIFTGKNTAFKDRMLNSSFFIDWTTNCDQMLINASAYEFISLRFTGSTNRFPCKTAPDSNSRTCVCTSPITQEVDINFAFSDTSVSPLTCPEQIISHTDIPLYRSFLTNFHMLLTLNMPFDLSPLQYNILTCHISLDTAADNQITTTMNITDQCTMNRDIIIAVHISLNACVALYNGCFLTDRSAICQGSCGCCLGLCSLHLYPFFHTVTSYKKRTLSG